MPRALGWLKRLAQAVLVAVVVAGVVDTLWRFGLLSWADNYVSDTWHFVRPAEDPADLPVVLIAIDDETLKKIDDPLVFWSPHLAVGIQNLHAAGASVVGLDVLFTVSGEDWLSRNMVTEDFLRATEHVEDVPELDDISMKARNWDGPMRMVIAMGKVVLVGFVAPDPTPKQLCESKMKEFSALLPSQQSHSGYSNLSEDTDGVVRRARPVIFPETEALTPETRKQFHCPALQFGLVMVLHHLQQDLLADGWNLPGRAITRADRYRVPIHFAGPRGTFPSVPFWKVAAGELSDEERALIAGRVAIIGTSHTGDQDIWMTPYDRIAGEERRRMPGMEVQANVVNTLISGTVVRELNGLVRGALFLGLGLGLAIVFSFASLRVSGLIVVLQAICWPSIGYFLFSYVHVILPAASMGFLGLAVFGAVYAARFSGEEQERRHLRQVFSRYVSDDVVGEILSSPEKLGLGGVSREITILFSDIRNFTTISEQLEPEEVVEMLNEYFARACPHILENRGRVDKFIGDAVMAVFGAPVHQEDHARQALRAATGMSKECDAFKTWMKERFPDRDLPEFDIGIGIHTGPAVAGNIGFDRVTEYAVIGDAVNTASRLEGLTKQLGVRTVLSRQTLEAAGRGIQTGEKMEVPVKGRVEPVEVLEFISMSTITLPERA